MGQARALIGARDPERLAREVIDRDLSVRETEKLAREVKAGGAGANAASRDRGEPNADIAALERQLGDLIGLHVKISHGDTGGTLTLTYSTLDQLDIERKRVG